MDPLHENKRIEMNAKCPFCERTIHIEKPDFCAVYSCPYCARTVGKIKPLNSSRDSMKKKCKICSELSNQEAITLANGDIVHPECESKQFLRIQEARKRLETLRIRGYELKKDVDILQCRVDQLSKTSFLSSLYECVVGERTSKEVERLSQLSQAQSLLQKALIEIADFKSKEPNIKEAAEKDIKDAKEILRPIYDYWPDYPPDWEERREEVHAIVDSRCQRCGFKKHRTRTTDDQRTFHVHHKIPISRGGDHSIDNLKLLCIKCHDKVHPYNISRDLDKVGLRRLKTTFTDKVKIINKAIETQSTLRFKYKKRDGQIMLREIRPAEITKDSFKHKVFVVGGYCCLRKATRHFTIARMNQIQIINQEK